MKPENIDNLFKERLGNSTPTPPADLWARLQERMEAEELTAAAPQPQAEKPVKQRFFWMYSSVAATLSLLLTVGVVFYNIDSGTPEIQETLTKHDSKQPQELPLSAPDYTSAATEEVLSKQVEPEAVDATQLSEEKKSSNQATAANQLASNITKATETQKASARKNTNAVQRQTLAKSTPVSDVAKVDAQPAIASSKKPVTEYTVPTAATVDVVPATLAAAKSDANMNAEPVEIIIKRSVAAQTAMAESNPQTDGNKKVALAKNIFKQVRNLASGEGVELADLGIRADRVALETKIGKQKISKVINL
ncbi:hypothetical protein [Pontibacter oryzae]|uniref:Uncharacterized protein n=1 Tax=Pontibacter oryzae TaxID=2304593 RepID=A0A399SC74_9BACT|nr:hypothetical protein [Pontibacter oryzae]RIJ41666.1 hypothetical protein D1627_06460 [Pontibacter oryzae]